MSDNTIFRQKYPIVQYLSSFSPTLTQIFRKIKIRKKVFPKIQNYPRDAWPLPAVLDVGPWGRGHCDYWCHLGLNRLVVGRRVAALGGEKPREAAVEAEAEPVPAAAAADDGDGYDE